MSAWTLENISRATYSDWVKSNKNAAGKEFVKAGRNALNSMRRMYKQACGPLKKPHGLHVAKIGDLKMIWATVNLLAAWWAEDTKPSKPMKSKKMAAFLWCVVALDKAIMARRGPMVVKGFKV